MKEYRYKTLGARGSVVIDPVAVTCEATSYLGRWKTVTPLSAIAPHPIQGWYTAPVTRHASVFSCFLLSLSISVIIREIRFIDQISLLPVFFFTLVSVGSALAIYRTIRHWTIEWLTFPTEIEGHRISYARAGRDAHLFEEFTAYLMAQVAASKDSRANQNVR